MKKARNILIAAVASTSIAAFSTASVAEDSPSCSFKAKITYVQDGGTSPDMGFSKEISAVNNGKEFKSQSADLNFEYLASLRFSPPHAESSMSFLSYDIQVRNATYSKKLKNIGRRLVGDTPFDLQQIQKQRDVDGAPLLTLVDSSSKTEISLIKVDCLKNIK